jgi:hypothetical protein
MSASTDSRFPCAPRIGGDHFVVLEPEVLVEFESFVKRTKQEIEEQRQRREAQGK